MSLFLKLENHFNDPNLLFNIYNLSVPDFTGTQMDGPLFNTNDNFISGVWYDIKKFFFSQGETSVKWSRIIWLSHVQGLFYADILGNSKTYNLPVLSIYQVDNANGDNPKIVEQIFNATNNLKNGTGMWITLKKLSYSTRQETYKNQKGDFYFILVIGSIKDPIVNPPLIRYNDLHNVGYNSSGANISRHCQYLNMTIFRTNSDIAMVNLDKDKLTNQVADVYKNGSMVGTLDLSDIDSKVPLGKANYNDVFEFKNVRNKTATPAQPATPTVKYATVKSDEENPNYTINYSKVQVGKSYNIVVTAKDNYEFYDKAYIILNNSQKRLLISSDKKSLNYGQPITINNTNDIIIHAETRKIKIDDKDRTKIPITLNLTHCTSNVTYLLSMGEGLPDGNFDVKVTDVTLTADDGYIFDKDVTYFSYAPEIVQYLPYTVKATNTNTITFTMFAGLPSDYDKNLQGKYPSITAIASAKNQPVSTGLDAIHLYNMHNSELDNLSNKIIEFQKTNGDINKYDYTRFINQVYRLPFAIPSSIQTTVTKVECGIANLSVDTHQLLQENYDIDVGTIDCTGVNKNSLDYNSLQCTLIIPFVPSIKLSINDLVDNKLAITYRINLLNGMCTVVVDNDTGNIYTSNVSVATNLQIFGSYEDKDVGNLNSILNNKIRQAYLIITSNEPVNNLACYPCNDHGKLKDYHGLTKTANTKLNFGVSLTERNDIINQLESGVIIK